MPTLDLTGLKLIQNGYAKLARPDAAPLMAAWEGIIREDNREGVLAGLDKDGRPMAPLTSRPRPAPARRRKGARPLGASNYKGLTGPPLAPLGASSNVITKLETSSSREGDVWRASAGWPNVVNKKGQHYLDYNFEGGPRLPRRDLRGVRPAGVRKAVDALKSWYTGLLHAAFPAR